MKYSVIIIGAGASGLMCAKEAAKRGKKVAIIDHRSPPARKVLVSGGGRCNFTNLNLSAQNYISNNPHFVKSAIARFKPADFLKLLDEYQIGYEEKNAGQMFCKMSSREIAAMLEKGCETAGVTFFMNEEILALSKNAFFKIKLKKDVLEAPSLVVATGGLSCPELGASDFGIKVARSFGHKIVETHPALVPLLFNRSDKALFSKLSGVSLRAKVTCRKTEFTDDMLFTHAGLSGPAILQISSYWTDGETVMIDLLPKISLFKLMQKKKKVSGKVLIKNFLSGLIPKRAAETFCKKMGLAKNLSLYSDKELKRFEDALHNWKFTPSGTAGYKKAEATRGGVDTSEVSSKMMESLKVKGLYFAGEVLDVVGQLGGYNLHWAWASGYCAGQFV